MKIHNNISFHTQNTYSKPKVFFNIDKKTYETQYITKPIYYSHISFGTINNTNVKPVNIEEDKNKLLRQINEILDSTTETDPTDAALAELNEKLNFKRTKLKKQKELLEKANLVAKNTQYTRKQKSDILNGIKKEFNSLKKQKAPAKKKIERKHTDKRLDYKLLNKFKSALKENDFDLKKLFINYYGNLEKLSSIEELAQAYPKIKIPVKPSVVIAKKIETCLTRDFYIGFNELLESNDKEKLYHYCNKKINEIVREIADTYNLDAESLYFRIATDTHEAIIDKFIQLKKQNSFSIVPEQRKKKLPNITETDLKLLCIDFDKFVLTVIKRHYLDSEKLNDIKYTDNGITINVNSLKEPEYKFEKMSEKVKSFINKSQILKNAQRDYEHFDNKKLKERLNFYANSAIGNNEKLLARIIDFDSCKFEKQDIEALNKFLRILDDLYDEKTSYEDAIFKIQKFDVYPKGTEKLNEQERLRASAQFKADQQKNFELNKIKEKFDEAIDSLYLNNMNNVANICYKYRPESPDEESRNKANYIIEAVNKNSKKGNEFLNKNRIESAIMRWDTFNYYKKSDSQNPIFKKALEFAKQPDGNINEEKAGQYIINAEIVEGYPETSDFVKYPELLSKIMEKLQNDTDSEIRYLSKLDEYSDLNITDKTYISNILDIFDLKDPIDKIILKQIIENDYCSIDTCKKVNIPANTTENINATITAKAKQQIIEKYKFPLCIDFLKNFEEALSCFATEKGTSGIKRIGRNNKSIQYQLELKLKDQDDRLFSVEDNYYFDIFSDKGRH